MAAAGSGLAASTSIAAGAQVEQDAFHRIVPRRHESKPQPGQRPEMIAVFRASAAPWQRGKVF